MLAGIHATWEFDTDSVLIRFERGIRAPKLFQSLRERRIPYAALSSVTLTPGKRGTVVLHAVPRPGADPLLEAAAGQLKEGNDPYRLVLPAERETLAEYYADELRGVLPDEADLPAERFMVTAPEAPMHFKAYDGRAGFDGSLVSFRWFWTGASSAKWKAGDQTFPVAELGGVEWRSPEAFEGYFRLVPRGTSAESGPARIPSRCPRAVSSRTRIPRPSSSGWGTARCTSRSPSPRRSWSRCAGPSRCPWRPSPRRWAARGATPRTSPSGYATSGTCTRRAW